MTTDWPPGKKLPPGFPLAAVDESGRPIVAGAKVRIESVDSCAHGLPPEDQARLKSYEGKVLPVLEIDRYGMIWFRPEGGSGNFSLKPRELSVVGAASGMKRRIASFHQDEEGHWVAHLECGHSQHTRHQPPFVNRPWVTTPEGRQGAIGTLLECKKCGEGAPPDAAPPPD